MNDPFQTSRPGRRSEILRTLVILFVLTVVAIAVHGYHLGIEDQAIYLPAIKLNLNPSLYPHDAELFLPQARATSFDELVAWTVKFSGMSVDWAILAWHTAAIFALLLGCYRIAARCFPGERARFGAVALLASLLTIPVAGTALYIADQYLHPRTLATAFILLAIAEVLNRRWVPGGLWLLAAVAVHFQMAFFGGVLILFLLFPLEPIRSASASICLLLSMPLGAMLVRNSPEWREAMLTRSQHFLLRWQWYEWLGVIAPLAILWSFRRLGRSLNAPIAAGLSTRLFWFTVVTLVAGVVVTIPTSLERLTPFQPLRALHLIYLLMFLLAGGFLAESVLKTKAWRWLILFAPLCAGMYYGQRNLFVASRHIEWPGTSAGNQWVKAFEWVRDNTPVESYFAMDPRYISSPGEDYHGFRALAERSQLADWDKDPGVVTLFPAAALRWSREVHALDQWNRFEASDFRRLKAEFGVDWVILDKRQQNQQYPPDVRKKNNPPFGLDCPYQNPVLFVCKVN